MFSSDDVYGGGCVSDDDASDRGVPVCVRGVPDDVADGDVPCSVPDGVRGDDACDDGVPDDASDGALFDGV